MSRIADSIKAHRRAARAATAAKKSGSAPKCTEMRKKGGPDQAKPVGRLKTPGIIIPFVQQERIFQKYIAGMSASQIAREEKRDRRTVMKIVAVRAEDEQLYVQKTRELFVGMGGTAIASVKQSIEKGNAEMGYRLLVDIGAVPNKATVGSRAAVDINQRPPASHADLAIEELAARMPGPQRVAFAMLQVALKRREVYDMEPVTYEVPAKESVPVADVEKGA